VRLEGDHMVREPLDHIRREGFQIEHLERSKWGVVERVVALKVEDETNPFDRSPGAPPTPEPGAPASGGTRNPSE
jgi:hypothetical protein